MPLGCASNNSITEPPITEPPITEPPITEPPITEPPITEPPITEHPIAEPLLRCADHKQMHPRREFGACAKGQSSVATRYSLSSSAYAFELGLHAAEIPRVSCQCDVAGTSLRAAFSRAFG